MKTHAEFLEELKKFIFRDQLAWHESVSLDERNEDLIISLRSIFDKIEQFEAELKQVDDEQERPE